MCTIHEEIETSNNMLQVRHHALMNKLINKHGLLIPLVDLVREGYQNIQNALVRLGVYVRDKLVVPLA
jgi:hypothetical protein